MPRSHPESHLFGLAYGDGSLWVNSVIYNELVPLSEQFSTVSRIRRLDPATGTVLDQISVADMTFDGDFIRPRLSWQNGLLWLNDVFGQRYLGVDPITGASTHIVNNPWGNFSGVSILEPHGPGVDDTGRLFISSNFGETNSAALPRLTATGRLSWLGLDNRGGLVTPSADTLVTVTVTADRAGLGTHSGQVIIGSDDPDNAERRIVLPVSLTVTDGRSNQAPVISGITSNADAANEVNLPTPFLPMVSASDPDGDALSYSWGILDGPDVVTIIDGDTASPTINLSSPGAYTFRVEVSDDRHSSVSQDIAVIMTAAGKRFDFKVLPTEHDLTVATASTESTAAVSALRNDGFDLSGVDWVAVSPREQKIVQRALMSKPMFTRGGAVSEEHAFAIESVNFIQKFTRASSGRVGFYSPGGIAWDLDYDEATADLWVSNDDGGVSSMFSSISVAAWQL